MALRVVFFGSPEFAVPSLRAIQADRRFDVALVVTQPDRRAGRGRRVVEPAVKSLADALGLPVWQPESLRSDVAIDRLASLRPDLFLVAAYGAIFRRAVLAIPLHGSLNVHPSLLPRYRGSSPIQAAILHGDRATGVSIIEMVRKLDAGPIVARREIPLDGSETGGSLSRKLADLAGGMLADVAAAWCNRTITPMPQEEARATFTRELTKADGRIDWSESAEQIERQVRAYAPWPTAWTTIDGRRVVIHGAVPFPCEYQSEPGVVVEDAGAILVICGSGSLRLLEVQPEGGRSMAADAWFRGLRTKEVPRLGAGDSVSPAEDGSR